MSFNIKFKLNYQCDKEIGKKVLTISQTVEGTDGFSALCLYSFRLRWGQVSTIAFSAACPGMVTLGESLSLARRKPIRLLEGREEMQGVYHLLLSFSTTFLALVEYLSPVSPQRQPVFYGCSSNSEQSLFSDPYLSFHFTPSVLTQQKRSSPQGQASCLYQLP